MIDERQIIKGCKQYNKTAQKALFTKYSSLMLAVCQRYAQNCDEAKDIMQEGFIKVFSKMKQYSGKGSLEGWIRRIMVNSAINQYRKNKPHYFHHRVDEKITADAGLYNPTSTDLEIDAPEIDRTDVDSEKINFGLIDDADFSKEQILEVIDQLPMEYKLVFNMYCIENYKHREIAKLLKLGVITVRSRLHRARNMIQQRLYQKAIEKLCK